MAKQITAYFNEVNFSTFIAAMIIQTAITSLIIQFLFENHHPKHIPKLITALIKSNTLIVTFFIFIIGFLKNRILLNRKRV